MYFFLKLSLVWNFLFVTYRLTHDKIAFKLVWPLKVDMITENYSETLLLMELFSVCSTFFIYQFDVSY